MGGFAECGVGADNKASPRRAAIEKAQEELRFEYDVREERRRELEFLEKGGNPLDFKLGNSASPSVQSTSLAKHPAEHNITSELKDSPACAASPHGDSVESSGKPGSLLGRDPNVADNSLLLDGDNSNIGSDLRSLHTEALYVQKEHDDAATPRLAAKGQAYARRNRLKSSRDTAVNASFKTGPTTLHARKDLKGSTHESLPEDDLVASISNSKPASPNTALQTAASDEQVVADMDIAQTDEKAVNFMNNRNEQDENVDIAVETSQADGNDGRLPSDSGDVTSGGQPGEAPFVVKNEATGGELPEGPSPCAQNFNEYMVNGNAVNEQKDNSCINIPVDADLVGTIENKSELETVNPIKNSKEHSDANNISLSEKTAGKSGGESKSSDICVSNVAEMQSCQLKTIAGLDFVARNGNSVQKNVKDKMEVCDVNDKSKIEQSACPELQKASERDKDSEASDAKPISMSVEHATAPDSAANETEAPNAVSHSQVNPTSGNLPAIDKKEHEDSIIRKARVIKANLRKANTLNSSNMSLEKRPKCHWDFVLEEMAWMANDFMQERLWKISAASQMCRWVAASTPPNSRPAIHLKQKRIAKTLGKAVLNFWQSIEAKCIGSRTHKEGNEITSECKSPIKPVEEYARQFLEFNSTLSDQAEAPPTPDKLHDVLILEISDHISEESLFYTVPLGAVQLYRELVESQNFHKKTNGPVDNADCEMPVYNFTADGARENMYDEGEGETSTNPFGGYDHGPSSKFNQKKRHYMQPKMNGARPHELRTDLGYDHCLESKSGNHAMLSNGKRPSNFLNVVSIPTKRMRTTPRVRGPFGSTSHGGAQATSKTDVSSGDTNSCQDDQSSLHGSLHMRNAEVESNYDFDRQWPYDGEVSTKSKKKKPKTLGYSNSLNVPDSYALTRTGHGLGYEPKIPYASTNYYDQKEYFKRRSDVQHVDSNGNFAGNAQHPSKKKQLKQAPDTFRDTISPALPIASTNASHMSNMASPSKHPKIVNNRDRVKKSKSLKMTTGYSGSGYPWSNFEDQALVVLVHDMGQNWELVSDALNSTMYFKRVFRKATECRERHKFLMDKSAGDGADSADDSGSSQQYISTLPGIPKGSARQLFQRLQGPLEEDTIREHFKKIISLGQQLQAKSRQGDSQELKQIIPPHNSHIAVVSQFNSMNGGGNLTPLDLCDSNSETSPLSYPGPHANGVVMPGHHSSGSPIVPAATGSPRIPGSPGMIAGNLPSSPLSVNGATRDPQRYLPPRASSLQGDEQQRMQLYSQMMSGRNIQQPAVHGPLPAGVDHSGVRMLPGAHAMGVMPGMSRGMAVRPGFQRLTMPGMVNVVQNGNTLPTSGQAIQNTVNVHPGMVSAAGNSMIRPHDPMQMLRPAQNLEDHRQMIMPEMPMQPSPGNNAQGHFISSPFPNGTAPPIQSFPLQQPQQPHPMAQDPHKITQQQAYAMRFVKERPMQQQMIARQHAFSGTGNIPGAQQLSQPPSAHAVATPQSQHKPPQLQHSEQSLADSSVLPNQPGNTSQHKQNQKPQQQLPRQVQQQKQQAKQYTKHPKNHGKGSAPMHLPTDGNQAGGSFSALAKNQVPSEKGMVAVQHSQGFFQAGPALVSSVQLGNQPKMYTQMQQSTPIAIMPSHPSHHDVATLQSSVQGSSSQAMIASQPQITPTMIPQQSRVVPPQNSMQRIMIPQNRQLNSDSSRIEPAATAVPSLNKRKQDNSFEASTAPSPQLASTQQDMLAANENAVASTPAGQGLMQRQVSADLTPKDTPLHGDGVRQWQQQQLQLQQQQQQQHQQPQQRPAHKGGVYVQPSDAGSG